MMISTKGRYALRVMIDLAEHTEEGYIPLRDIAERQEISKKYLEIIMSELVKSGMVSGISGKHGGYSLTRDPSDYPVSDILKTMEGDLAPVACLRDGAEPCPRAASCRTLPLWSELNDIVSDFLSSKRLSDLTANT